MELLTLENFYLVSHLAAIGTGWLLGRHVKHPAAEAAQEMAHAIESLPGSQDDLRPNTQPAVLAKRAVRSRLPGKKRAGRWLAKMIRKKVDRR